MDDYFDDLLTPSDGPLKRHINLWRAVLMQGLKDTDNEDPGICDDAIEWIKSNDRKCFNSFLNLCELCDVSAKELRRILRKKSCFYCGGRVSLLRLNKYYGEYYCRACISKLRDSIKRLNGN